MIKKMKAIEYNILMTLITSVSDGIKNIAGDYGIKDTNITVLPAYPRDLTRFKKPSVVVQRVHHEQGLIGMTGFAGQYYDVDIDTISDVYAVEHLAEYQIDVIADNHSTCLLLSALICEGIINTDMCIVHGGRVILKDFTASIKDPTDMGIMKIISELDIVSNDSSTYNRSIYEYYKDRNNDYITSIRFNLSAVQTILPTQEYINLSKWLKFKQTVRV